MNERVQQDPTWKVRSSRQVHRDRWLSVRADDCLTSSGVEVAPYYVLEYPDWVHVVALDEHDRLIMVRQYRHGYGGHTLELPGGSVDSTDATPLDAAARELAEETGGICEELRLVASLSPNPATHTNRVHLILGTNVVLGNRVTPDLSEEISIEVVPMNSVVELALTGAMIHVQHVGLLMIAMAATGRLGCASATRTPVGGGAWT